MASIKLSDGRAWKIQTNLQENGEERLSIGERPPSGREDNAGVEPTLSQVRDKPPECGDFHANSKVNRCWLS